MQTELPPVPARRLEVGSRRVVEADGRESTAFFVRCPKRDGSVPVAECSHCSAAVELKIDPARLDSHVRCVAPPERSGGGAEPNAPVQSIMTRAVVCVRPELEGEALTALLVEESLSGVPVVDPEGRPIGMVSKTDLLWEDYEDAEAEEPSRRPRRRASDAMTPGAICVSEDASVTEAAARMATHGVHRLPVVDGDGKVVGMISAIDLAAWLARRAGHAIPEKLPRRR